MTAPEHNGVVVATALNLGTQYARGLLDLGLPMNPALSLRGAEGAWYKWIRVPGHGWMLSDANRQLFVELFIGAAYKVTKV